MTLLSSPPPAQPSTPEMRSNFESVESEVLGRGFDADEVDRLRGHRLGTVVHVVNSLVEGGTERALVNLLERFKANRFRHMVVTLRQGGPLAAQLPDDVACHCLGALGPAWTTGLRLATILSKQRADVIHARNTGSWADAVLAQRLYPAASLVLGFHGLDGPGPMTSRQRLKAQLGLWQGAEFATVSQAARDQLQQEADIPSSRIQVIPNGVDSERFYPRDETERARVRQSLELCESDLAVGIVSSLTRVKRHDLFLEAFVEARRVVPTLKGLVIGEGPLRANLQSLATQLQIESCVQFLGQRGDVADLLGALDMYVCCSDSEGMSNALLEALASGIAVVASDVADHAKLLDHGRAGLLFTKGSSALLSEKLIELAHSGERRRTLANRGCEMAREFDFNRTVAAYEDLYNRVAEVPRFDSEVHPLATYSEAM